ncbi:MAG: Fur family transcriptional regulator [Saprospiraceae bacterium]
MRKSPDAILGKSGLRKTPFRVHVLGLFMQQEEALSAQQLENFLPDADRVTLYRTLRTFEQKGIIHLAIDGTHCQKYALCSDSCDEHHHVDQHAHFHCVTCGKTFCINDTPQPAFQTPKGFVVQSSHLVLHGICPDCR